MKYYKFLNDNLTSFYNPKFYYPSPIFKNGEWTPSEWITEQDISENRDACGKGLHLMKVLIPIYTQYRGNCYEAEGDGLLGEDENKARFRKIRLLRPIPKSEIIKARANLHYANLSSADLHYANLSYADLSLANLHYANLSSANLSSADLRLASLSYANLRYANLSSANLSSADLRYANLSYADLHYANLSSANNLDYAYWNKFTQIDKEYKKLLDKKRFLK